MKTFQRMIILTLLLCTSFIVSDASNRFAGYVTPTCLGLDDTDALTTAIATGAPIIISKGSTCAGNDIKFTVSVTVEDGGLLKPLTGHTIWITSDFEAGSYKTFTNALSGQGTVSFAGNVRMQELRPEWWGAKGDGTTINDAFFAAAQAALPTSGGVIKMGSSGTYKTTVDTVANRSHVTWDGNGSLLSFEPAASAPGSDRAFVVFTGNTNLGNEVKVTGALQIGEKSFEVASTSGLVAGDWLVVYETDANIPAGRDVVAFDWFQVAGIARNTVSLYSPNRTFFSAKHSAVVFRKVVNPVQNVTVRNWRCRSLDPRNSLPCFTASYSRNVTFENLDAAPQLGNPYYGYRNQGFTLVNSRGSRSNGQAMEIAESVDVVIHGNTFATDGVAPDTALLTLDMGLGFFSVTNNIFRAGNAIGVQFLYGVHDGSFSNNIVTFVSNNRIASGFGISSLGSQRVNVSNNVLTGGAGPASVGIAFGDTSGLVANIPTMGNVIDSNIVSNFASPYGTPAADDTYIIPQAGQLRIPSRLLLGTATTADADAFIYHRGSSSAALATRYEWTGSHNWYTGPEIAGNALLYWGFNTPSDRRMTLDQNGYLNVNPTATTGGGLAVGGGTKLTKVLKGEVTVNPTSIRAQTVSSQVFTLSGAVVGDTLNLNPPAAGLTMGLLVAQCFVSGPNTITIVFFNQTGAPIDEASAAWSYTLIRN